MKPEISNPHDRFFKKLFSREDVGRDFFLNYLPREVVSLLDLDSSELTKDSFVDQELGEYFSDMTYKVRLKQGGKAYIYILLEHKSYSEPLAGFQILCYMVRIWESVVRRHGDERKAENKARKKSRKTKTGKDKSLFRLPFVIPVLICHGRSRWNVPMDFRSLFGAHPEMEAYIPDFGYLLCDLSRYSDDEIKGMVLLKVGMLVMKHIFRDDLAERLPEILGLLRELSDKRTGPEFLKTIVRYLAHGAGRLSKEELGKSVRSAFPETGGELMATVAEQWFQEGKAKGKAEGELIGKILLAQQILRQTVYSREALDEKSPDELRKIFSEFESRLSA